MNVFLQKIKEDMFNYKDIRGLTNEEGQREVPG
jgi:hypothetical protein